MISLVEIGVLLLLLQSCYAAGCPSQCQCFLGSKVICSEESMILLPATLSPQVKELIIITSGLMSIPPNSFDTCPNLTKLALISNPLTGSAISPLAFSGLTALEELEISADSQLGSINVTMFETLNNLNRLFLNNNQMLMVETGLFDRLLKLEVLEMKGNGFQLLPKDLFQNLQKLKSLDLSINMMGVFEAYWLAGLTQLQSLKLGYNRITTVPSDLFKYVPGLKHLSFQSNIISELAKGLFTSFTKLEVLNLRYNRLAYVRSGTFPTSLKELNLQGNKLRSLIPGNLPLLTDLVLSTNRFKYFPRDLFENLTSLEHLDLSENQLLSLHATMFSGLSKIISILLHKNNLTSLPADLFKDQKIIERLTLSDNRLKNLPDGLFDPFIETRNVISLSGNLWHCDCNLTYLHTWLEFGGYLVQDLSKTYCEGPVTLRGHSLKSVNRDQLVCSYNSNTTNTNLADPVQAPREKASPQGQTNECILQKLDGIYSLKCTITKCSNLNIVLQIQERDGSIADIRLDNEWSETSQCANGTLTVNV